ncbi:MAG: short-chain dehydrogenase [Bacteroidetes bacterium]|nr:MAG: short-chain dehydrogenase [Bacteroidota bacterium]
MFELNDKVAVVTGGGSGIGRSCAEVLSSQGAHVFLFELNASSGKEVAQNIRDTGGQCTFVQCDVGDQESVRQAFKSLDKKSGTLDILVNNAGVSHIGNLENTTEEAMDKVFKVNVKGAFYCLSEAVPRMKKTGGGRIVNIASSAVWVGISDRFAYSMSKAAVANMSLTVAKDYVNDNIQSNSISPGRVHTPFVDQYLARHYPGQEAEMFEKLSKTQPIGRMASPDEIAYLALYLSSDESGFITGSDYIIDGGMITLNT